MAFRVPTIQELSDEQRAVFDLPADGRYLIDGPPGTGKTVLALLRAQRLVLEGRRPTVLLFHNALSAMVVPEAGRLDVEDRVHTYYPWVREMWKKATGQWSVPKVDDWNYDWDAIAERAEDILAVSDQLDIQDVIVDEAQDLPAAFFGLLRAIGSNITVFADENQQLTQVNSNIEELEAALLPKRLSVHENYRNTTPVAKLAREFFTGTVTGIPGLPEREGTRPRIVRSDDLHGFARTIVRVTISPPARKDIGVFVLYKVMRDKLAGHIQEEIASMAAQLNGNSDPRHRATAKRLAELKDQVYVYSGKESLPPLGKGGIFVICNSSGKGLEFDATHVWLQKIDVIGEIAAKMQLYVLSSRPRHELYLGWAGATAESAPKKLPGWVLDIDDDLLERVVLK